MISCDENALFFGPVMWVFELIKKAYSIDILEDQLLNVRVGTDAMDQIRLSKSFYDNLINQEKYPFENYFDKIPLITTENGKPDYISSIFYLVNGCQEYNLSSNQKDKYGRLEYKKSLQYKYDILEKDLVQEYIQKLLFQIDKSLRLPKSKSRIFISHDIDSVYGSLKYDGLWAIKNGKISEMLKLILQTLMLNPPWFNIDKVARLENEYDIKACYYWIVKNGRDAQGIKNGDYKIGKRKIQTQLKYAQSLGNEMGLHKSTMPYNFSQEISNLTEAQSNRFHFLKINNPESFLEMESQGIHSDSSIGFPYNMGFKNSFGLPFYPYDLNRKGKGCVLEIPLQIMDGMFVINDPISMEMAYNRIVDFMEANNTNAVISILWHNSEMTNFTYKWSFECYKKLLHYIHEMEFETVLPAQLVKQYEFA